MRLIAPTLLRPYCGPPTRALLVELIAPYCARCGRQACSTRRCTRRPSAPPPSSSPSTCPSARARNRALSDLIAPFDDLLRLIAPYCTRCCGPPRRRRRPARTGPCCVAFTIFGPNRARCAWLLRRGRGRCPAPGRHADHNPPTHTSFVTIGKKAHTPVNPPHHHPPGPLQPAARLRVRGGLGITTTTTTTTTIVITPVRAPAARRTPSRACRPGWTGCGPG